MMYRTKQFLSDTKSDYYGKWYIQQRRFFFCRWKFVHGYFDSRLKAVFYLLNKKQEQ